MAPNRASQRSGGSAVRAVHVTPLTPLTPRLIRSRQRSDRRGEGSFPAPDSFPTPSAPANHGPRPVHAPSHDLDTVASLSRTRKKRPAVMKSPRGAGPAHAVGWRNGLTFPDLNRWVTGCARSLPSSEGLTSPGLPWSPAQDTSVRALWLPPRREHGRKALERWPAGAVAPGQAGPFLRSKCNGFVKDGPPPAAAASILRVGQARRCRASLAPLPWSAARAPESSASGGNRTGLEPWQPRQPAGQKNRDGDERHPGCPGPG